MSDIDETARPIRGVSELALWVRDLPRAVAFYRDVLGFAVVEIDAGRNAFLRSGDLLLGLFVLDNPGTPLADEYLTRTGGEPRGHVYHVGFRVDPERLDAFAAELGARRILKGPVNFPNGRRSYFLEDPDAHYIELTDR